MLSFNKFKFINKVLNKFDEIVEFKTRELPKETNIIIKEITY
jgi:hypothetical protein